MSPEAGPVLLCESHSLHFWTAAVPIAPEAGSGEWPVSPEAGPDFKMMSSVLSALGASQILQLRRARIETQDSRHYHFSARGTDLRPVTGEVAQEDKPIQG